MRSEWFNTGCDLPLVAADGSLRASAVDSVSVIAASDAFPDDGVSVLLNAMADMGCCCCCCCKSDLYGNVY